MQDLWECWVPDEAPEEFLEEADIAVAEGLYADRRAAFLDYAASASADRDGTAAGAGRLGDLLLAYAETAEAVAACRDAPAEAPRPMPASKRAGRRVLIIEDHPDGREMLELLVRAWGHEVEVAGDGREGVGKALAWHPDVAVVDIGLPLLDGYGVACQVRAALHDGVRLIALTAYSQDENRRRAFESGFDHFMTKPADLDQLAELVGSP